jgi:hypothetical protein
MFKRLVFLLMLVVATASVSSPTHAATLVPNQECGYVDGAPGVFIIECYARASGGFGPYIYRWYVNSTLKKEETLTATGYSTFSTPCRVGTGTKTVLLVVTDRTGAQASQASTYSC